MSVVNRDFGKPPVLKDILPRAKQFTDEAMRIDIDELLDASKTFRNVGKTAAAMCGVRLQLEGEVFSKDIVIAAYDQVYDVIQPSLDDLGADQSYALFTSDLTHATLTDLSNRVDSYEFSKLTYDYRNNGSHLMVTDKGLTTHPDFIVTPAMEAQRGGCPYAKNDAALYFNKFTDRIVETFAEAHRRDMPHGWFEAVGRKLGIS